MEEKGAPLLAGDVIHPLLVVGGPQGGGHQGLGLAPVEQGRTVGARQEPTSELIWRISVLERPSILRFSVMIISRRIRRSRDSMISATFGLSEGSSAVSCWMTALRTSSSFAYRSSLRAIRTLP